MFVGNSFIKRLCQVFKWSLPTLTSPANGCCRLKTWNMLKAIRAVINALIKACNNACLVPIKKVKDVAYINALFEPVALLQVKKCHGKRSPMSPELFIISSALVLNVCCFFWYIPLGIGNATIHAPVDPCLNDNGHRQPTASQLPSPSHPNHSSLNGDISE